MSARPVEREALSRSQQRRRDDIVEAALKIFDRDGFEGARIDDVAAEAGIAKGTVYLYFANKEALFEGVVRDVVKPAIEEVGRTAENEHMSASERLEAQVKLIGERLGKGSMKILLRLMIAEGPRHDNLRDFYFREVVEPGMAAIRKSLADGEASGEFRPGSADIHPQVLAGAPMMGAVWRILFQELAPLDIDALLDDHLRTVLAGLRDRS